MSSHTYTVSQPYEIIETLEETITRYFGPDLKEPSFFPADETHNSQNNRNEFTERFELDGPKIILRNCQFQDLFERFKKLRSAMSEITQRFKEISLMKEKATKISPFIDTMSTGNESICNINNGTKIQENTIGLENGVESIEGEVQKKTKSYDSHVSVIVEHFPVEMQLTNPTTKKVPNDDVNICSSYSSDRKCTSPYQPKTTESVILKKSKKLLISLIDKELIKAQTGQNTVPIEQPSFNDSVQLKLECIDKINDELRALKELEGIDT